MTTQKLSCKLVLTAKGGNIAFQIGNQNKTLCKIPDHHSIFIKFL